MVFKKGQSGNPSGRSKKRREIEALAQKLLEDGDKNKALDGLLKMAEDETEVSPKDRKAAWELLLAYGYGKPRQRVEVKAEIMSHEQALAALEKK